MQHVSRAHELKVIHQRSIATQRLRPHSGPGLTVEGLCGHTIKFVKLHSYVRPHLLVMLEVRELAMF